MSTPTDRLLIIDDEPEIGAFIGDVAEDLGFDVVATNTPEEFWSSYGPFAPTVIVIDLVMPHADGVELLRALAEKSAGAQILLISGVDPGILTTARRLGTDRGLRMLGALQKPMVVTDLEAMLRAGMQGHRAVTEPELREAIKAGQLMVHYQPKASLTRDGNWVIDAAEALVRWERPGHRMVMPDEFIPLAEQSDLISKVFDFVLRQALEQARSWRDGGLSLGIAVNVAPSQLRNDLTFPDRTADLLKEYELDGPHLTLEITESAVMTDAANAMDILTRFRLSGVRLSIDDFGSGYSSLMQLYRLPFTELKIDKSFVTEVHQDEEAETIVRSIVGLAHSLHMSVCAEGVETQQALDFLRSVGCEMAQGYFISKPLSPAELPEVVHRWNQGTALGTFVA